MEQHIHCTTEKIVFKSDENGFAVIRCRDDLSGDLFNAVGIVPDARQGRTLDLEGEWKEHPRYGRQFSIASYQEVLPSTTEGIEMYLASGQIKGIGPSVAKRIVQRFGEETFHIIETTPERLIEVPGIGRTKIEGVKKSWRDTRAIRDLIIFLQEYNISTAFASKIFNTYGPGSVDLLKENPYRLADDIWGIGFQKADAMAVQMGYALDSPHRLQSGLLYTLTALTEQGHCFAVRDQLVQAGAKLMRVSESLLLNTLDEMVQTEDIVADGEDGSYIYLPAFYNAEHGAARRLCTINETNASIKAHTLRLDEQLNSANGFEYDEIQLGAIKTATRSKITVLTGGPGTGKTTTALGIITAFRNAGAHILLAAPTARAAKRLSEATGMQATTIHRLLEANPQDGYQRNSENPLTGDVLILDECSMIDLTLMYNLLKAVPDTMTIVMIGDADQLPSVGSGNVLQDIIASEIFPVIHLTHIYRQSQDSRIITNAHLINHGEFPDISVKDSDFVFLERDGAEAAAQTVVSLFRTKFLTQYFDIESSEIQVLSPMKKGVAGVVNLNQQLQAVINPAGRGIRRGELEFRVGDKVMQMKNDYDKSVFNGEIGIIDYVDVEGKCLSVRFDDHTVEYDASDLSELSLAYATTIHKAQGCEYPVVIMVLLKEHHIMLQRNLLYTGITRGKKKVILVGSKEALAIAVQNVDNSKRNTLLCERLRRLA